MAPHPERGTEPVAEASVYEKKLESIEKRLDAHKERLGKEARADVKTLRDQNIAIEKLLRELDEKESDPDVVKAELKDLRDRIDHALEDLEDNLRTIEEKPTTEEVKTEHADFAFEKLQLLEDIDALLDADKKDGEGNAELSALRDKVLGVMITTKMKAEAAKALHAGKGDPTPPEVAQAGTEIEAEQSEKIQALALEFHKIARPIEKKRRTEEQKKKNEEKETKERKKQEKKEGARVKRGETIRAELQKELAGDEAFKIALLTKEALQEKMHDVLPTILEKAVARMGADAKGQKDIDIEVDTLIASATFDGTKEVKKFLKQAAKDLYKKAQDDLTEEVLRAAQGKQAEVLQKGMAKKIANIELARALGLHATETRKAVTELAVKALGGWGKYGLLAAGVTLSGGTGLFAVGAVAGVRTAEHLWQKYAPVQEGRFSSERGRKKKSEEETGAKYRSEEKRNDLQGRLLDRYTTEQQEHFREDNSALPEVVAQKRSGNRNIETIVNDPRWKGKKFDAGAGTAPTLGELRKAITEGTYDADPHFADTLREVYEEVVLHKSRDIKGNLIARLTSEGEMEGPAIAKIAESAAGMYAMEQMNLLYEGAAEKNLAGTKGTITRAFDALGRGTVEHKTKTFTAMTVAGIVAREAPFLRPILMAWGGLRGGEALAESARRKEGGRNYGQELSALTEKIMKGDTTKEERASAQKIMSEARAYLQLEMMQDPKRGGERAAIQRAIIQCENILVATMGKVTFDKRIHESMAAAQATERSGEQLTEKERAFVKKKNRYRILGVAAGALVGEGLVQWQAHQEFIAKNEAIYTKGNAEFARTQALEAMAKEQKLQDALAHPENGNEPGHVFPRGAEHELSGHQQRMLEREHPSGGPASMEKQGLLRSGTLHGHGVEVGNNHETVQMEYTDGAQEFMQKNGIRFDAHRGLFILEHGKNNVRIAAEHGPVTTDTVTVRLVDKMFPGDTKSHQYLQVEIVGKPADGSTGQVVRNLQRIFIEGEGRNKGECLGKFEGDVTYDNASSDVHETIVKTGTMTQRMDIDGDGHGDQITKLNAYEYQSDNNTYIAEAPAAADVVGADGTHHSVNLEALDTNGDQTITKADIDAGHYAYETSGAEREDSGTFTLSSHELPESGRAYDAMTEHLSYNEIHDALVARGVPPDNADSLDVMVGELGKNPGHYDETTKVLDYWNANTKHFDHANLSSFEGAHVYTLQNGKVSVIAHTYVVEGVPHFDGNGHLDHIGSESIETIQHHVRDAVLENKIANLHNGIDLHLFEKADGTLDEVKAQFALDPDHADLSNDRIAEILNHTRYYHVFLKFGDHDYNKMLTFENQFAHGSRFTIPADGSRMIINQPGAEPDYEIVNGKIHEVILNTAGKVSGDIGPDAPFTDIANAHTAIRQAHELFLQKIDAKEQAFITTELLPQFKDQDAMDAVLRNMTIADYLAHKGDMHWQPFEAPEAQWAREAFDKTMHKQLVDSGLFTEKGGALVPTTAFEQAHTNWQDTSLKEILESSFRTHHAHDAIPSASDAHTAGVVPETPVGTTGAVHEAPLATHDSTIPAEVPHIIKPYTLDVQQDGRSAIVNFSSPRDNMTFTETVRLPKGVHLSGQGDEMYIESDHLRFYLGRIDVHTGKLSVPKDLSPLTSVYQNMTITEAIEYYQEISKNF